MNKTNVIKNNKFYIYVYLDPRKPGKYEYSNLNISFLYQPFYVGKGSGKRYKDHLYNCNLNNNTNPYKIRKLKNILKEYPIEEVYRFCIIVHTSDDEEEIYDIEKHYIKNIGIASWNEGPLTNLSMSKGGISGSQYDGFEVYDLKYNRGILIKDIKQFDKKYNTKYIKNLWIQNSLIIKDRFCKLEDVELIKMNTNPYSKIVLYSDKHSKPIRVYLKSLKVILNSSTSRNLNKLLKKKITNINGYYIDYNEYINSKTDDKILLFKENNTFIVKVSEFTKFENKHNLRKGSMYEIYKCGLKSNRGYFINKEDNIKYYQKHAFLNLSNKDILYMTIFESAEYAKNMGFKYNFLPIVNKRQKTINGFSYLGIHE